MKVCSLLNNFIISLVSTLLVVSTMGILDAQVMQSGSYQMQSDSVNFGGGFSSSTNYQQESTFGEVATGLGTSATYNLYAGYQQMQTVFISISGATNVSLQPELGGVTGGESNGSTTITVITDSPAGYELNIKASDSPAMQSLADSIADYNVTGDPDFSFTYADGEAFFGFTPEGADITDRFRDNGALCNLDSEDASLACWEGLTTTDATIASAANANHPDGATTTIHFRVGIGSNAMVVPGEYVATTTVTAVAL